MSDPVRVGPAAAGWHEAIWPRRDAGPLAAVMMELIDWLVAQGYAPIEFETIMTTTALQAA